MTTDTLIYGQARKAAWHKAGVAVEATSASEVASQAGLDWSVSLHDITATYTVPGENGIGMVKDYIPIENKKAVIKTDPYGQTSAIGIVGNRYKVFQNVEIFGALDNLIDSSGLRYAAAGEYDGGAKVWMLMETPMEMTIADDPHSAFLLARTSHDGSSSVIIKPVIERLFCMNQINKFAIRISLRAARRGNVAEQFNGPSCVTGDGCRSDCVAKTRDPSAVKRESSQLICAAKRA